MRSDPVFGVMIDRRCRVRSDAADDEAPFALDDDGFLDPLQAVVGSADELVAGALVAPSVAAQAGALVLLGEPGAGKSTVFERLSTHHSDVVGQDHRVVWVDGADIVDEGTFDEVVGRVLRALPSSTRAWVESDEAEQADCGHDNVAVTLVIDQVDESPIVRRIAARIRVALRERDARQLRVLLACRTADYPAALTSVLADACGGCTLADLAPLTREEAIRLADSVNGVDGEALVSAAVGVGAGSLASVPLTLGLLARTYRRFGSLEGGPSKLYAQGVAELLEEPDEDRAPAVDGSTLAERTAAAGRIAALLLLSGRRTISRGRRRNGEHDLHSEEVIDVRATAGCAKELTHRVVEATLGTALFTGRGPSRTAFVHSSLAAYLCGRYLIEQRLPKEQLERLLLVAGGDETRSVPTVLRETAAWLVALDRPSSAGWLIRADPQSLVGHTSIITSPEARHMIVTELLNRAAEVELGPTRWFRHLQRLVHPGLDDQLQPVLESAGQEPPGDWPSVARVRLAVRLAAEAATPRLTRSLLALACSDDWAVVVRQDAAQAALRLDPQLAGPRLAELLSRFRDQGYAARIDPHDDLRGLLLTILWPRHIAVSEVLPLLRPRRRRQYLGLYYRFQHTFPADLSEADLPSTLDWATQQLQLKHIPSANQVYVEDPEESWPELVPDEEPLGGLDTELLEAIVDRTLTGVDAASRIHQAAELLLHRLERGDLPPVPAPLDVEDQTGQEPTVCRDLRRELALAMARLAVRRESRSRRWVVAVAYNWGDHRGLGHPRTSALLEDGKLRWANRNELLYPSDFPWVYAAITTATSRGDSELADALSTLAGTLFDTSDNASRDLAKSDHGHPVWPHIEHWFQPPANAASRAARPWRRTPPQADADRQVPSPDDLPRQLNELLDQAAGGDAESFWQLAWKLQADPYTGTGTRRIDDDLTDFPGVEALGHNSAHRLVAASLKYVSTGHDHADRWLGTGTTDKRGWAGYLALALLERDGSLREVPIEAWPSWVGALVWFPVVHGEPHERERKRRLLEYAAGHAAAALCDAVRRYVRGEFSQGRRATETDSIDPAWSPLLVDTWEDLMGELAQAVTALPALTTEETPEPGVAAAAAGSDGRDQRIPERVVLMPADDADQHALERWENMLVALHGGMPERAATIARQRLRTAPRAAPDQLLAARAARALLRSAGHRYWPEVHAIAEGNSDLGCEIALVCAPDEDRPLSADLDEQQVAGLYQWLSELFPPETDKVGDGFRFGGPDARARHWRDSTLRDLSTRGTQTAVAVLARLYKDYPDRILILSNLVEARAGVLASAWSPPEPSDLARLLESHDRRLVRSDGELCDLLIATLKSIELELPKHSELLWDRIDKRFLANEEGPVWSPKPEAALCAYVAHELTNRLARRGLAVNREVLVKPTDAYGAGDRTDVLVEAHARDIPHASRLPDRVAVVIEVKGAWNDELRTAQRAQLAERYLTEANATAGIYLVGWHPPYLWNDSRDWRRRRVAALDRDDLMTELRQQAEEIESELERLTVPFIMEIQRPARSQNGNT